MPVHTHVEPIRVALPNSVNSETMCGGQANAEGGMDHVQLSGAVRLPGVSMDRQPVYLRFSLPQMYPLVAPTLQARAFHQI